MQKVQKPAKKIHNSNRLIYIHILELSESNIRTTKLSVFKEIREVENICRE